MAPHPTIATAPRADALDALRGYAILTMALSGLVPWGTLPQWMYHAQLIAPQMKYDLTVPGLTWVDLVFPFFLFSMGAAFPLALGRRVEARESLWRLVASIFLRGALLIFFAIYVQHIAPTQMRSPDGPREWWLALLGFALLFPTLTRLPKSWSFAASGATRALGWIGCAAMLYFLNTAPNRSPLDIFHRVVKTSDIIIIVLANTAVFGSLCWLATRDSWAMRIAIMIALIGLRLASGVDGWVKDVWSWSPVPWAYNLYYLQYLLIVLPGTIAGDLIRSSLHAKQPSEPPQSWSPTRRSVLTAILLATIVAVVAGLQARMVATVVLAALAASVATLLTLRSPHTPRERMIADVVKWGLLWLFVGLVFEPYEGGVKKDRSTISYYLITSGLACLALAAFSLASAALTKFRLGGALVGVGQNPMIAYAGIRSLLRPVAHLTGLEALIASWQLAPWPGVAYALLKTLLLAAFVTRLTRRRIFWRT